jgi:hypothetical protein
MRMTVRANGPAAPTAVWDRYVRPQRWSEWSPQIRSVDYRGEIIAAGGTGVVHGPCGVPVRFEIDEVDHEVRRWCWRIKVAGIAMSLGHSVAPAESESESGADRSATSATTQAADGDGTTTTLVIEGPAPIVLGYAPIARIALERLVR